MHIELLLSSVTQDQVSRSPSESAFFGWRHGPAAGGDGDELAKYPKIAIRKEAWGSVFVHMPAQTVYWTDTEAVAPLERLAAGETLAQIKANPNGLPTPKVDEFERLVNKFNLTA